MFDSNLWRPTPQIAGVRKGWNCERGERCGSKRSEKERVLTCNDRSIGPVQTYRPSPQTYNSKGRAIGCVWKASGKVEFHIRAGACPAISGPKASIAICDWRRDPEKDPDVPELSGGVAICGKSRLSTEPRVIPVFRSTIPDRRRRYFEPLSTLV